MSIISSTSRTRYQSSSLDPFSFTMYWQGSSPVLCANLSGWSMEEVSVECRDRKLTLLLCSSREGFSSGTISGFTKSLCLPRNVGIRAITEIHNGMLTLTLPKVMSHAHNRRPNKMIMSPARRVVGHDHVVSSSHRHGHVFC